MNKDKRKFEEGKPAQTHRQSALALARKISSCLIKLVFTRTNLKTKECQNALYRVLASWLDSRVSNVVVDGIMADASPLTNSVFQGTVLGPPLWNHYFGDARFAVNDKGYRETTYADDMNMYKCFKRNTPQ